jgi:transposase
VVARGTGWYLGAGHLAAGGADAAGGGPWELETGTRCACPKPAATCRELLAVEPAVWTCVRVAGIEPTHNAAERGLRHAVQWRKTSDGTESAAGSHCVETILTVVATCRHQERPVLAYLTPCCQARYAGTEPPSLLPQTSS